MQAWLTEKSLRMLQGKGFVLKKHREAEETGNKPNPEQPSTKPYRGSNISRFENYLATHSAAGGGRPYAVMTHSSLSLPLLLSLLTNFLYIYSTYLFITVSSLRCHFLLLSPLQNVTFLYLSHTEYLIR